MALQVAVSATRDENDRLCLVRRRDLSDLQAQEQRREC